MRRCGGAPASPDVAAPLGNTRAPHLPSTQQADAARTHPTPRGGAAGKRGRRVGGGWRGSRCPPRGRAGKLQHFAVAGGCDCHVPAQRSKYRPPPPRAHMRACLRLRTEAVRADDDALASRARGAASAVGPALRRPVVRRQPQALRVAQPAAGGQGRPVAGAHGDGAGGRGGGEAGHAGTPTSVAPARPTGLPRSVPLSTSHFGSCDHFGLWRANGQDSGEKPRGARSTHARSRSVQPGQQVEIPLRHAAAEALLST